MYGLIHTPLTKSELQLFLSGCEQLLPESHRRVVQPVGEGGAAVQDQALAGPVCLRVKHENHEVSNWRKSAPMLGTQTWEPDVSPFAKELTLAHPLIFCRDVGRLGWRVWNVVVHTDRRLFFETFRRRARQRIKMSKKRSAESGETVPIWKIFVRRQTSPVVRTRPLAEGTVNLMVTGQKIDVTG